MCPLGKIISFWSIEVNLVKSEGERERGAVRGESPKNEDAIPIYKWEK